MTIGETTALCVDRCKMTFRDALGNVKQAGGTGFWVFVDAKPLFVTNKHNVDPAMTLGGSWILHELSIEMRATSGEDLVLSDTKAFVVSNMEDALFVADKADCAVIIDPHFVDYDKTYRPAGWFQEGSIATAHQLDADLKMMDSVTFIGYPGANGKEWWDTVNRLPIARAASVASMGVYHNPQIPTGDVSLVTGLSFAGSSGSPVISHEKGVRPGRGLTNSGYRPPRVVGIMAGHLQSDGGPTVPEMLRHGGLSYFTRSSSLVALIRVARATAFG